MLHTNFYNNSGLGNILDYLLSYIKAPVSNDQISFGTKSWGSGKSLSLQTN